MSDQDSEVEVVISGIGGVFPKSNNLAEFSERLLAGENLLTKDHRKVEKGFYQEIPDSRGVLKNETIKFDNTFFGVSKAVAYAMDELTCHLLQRTYEAIIDAGLSLHELKGSNTTVFMGTCHSDSDLVWTLDANDGYGIMGRNRCMNSNRVSYWLDIKGTSMSTDGGWINGLSNLFLGWDAIRRGKCDTALVGVANLQGHLLMTLQFNDMGFLSDDGLTRSFDESASGCGRSSSVVCLVLQRADIAKRSYATIGHVLSTFISEKHTVMQRTSQGEWERMLNMFYEESKIDKSKICYLEAHGSGHKDEDAGELNAVTEVLCKDRKSPLLIGCVKSNMGNAETSSATCGLVKSIIAMEKGEIPKNLHYNSPNSLCPGLTNGKLKVVDTNTPFPEGGWIAVNSHSFTGSYAHIVLKPHKKKKELKNDGIPRLVLLSDRTNEHVETLIEQVETEPYDPEFIGLMHEIYWKPPEKNLGRGYTILPKLENPVHENKIFDGQKRPIWFVFAGMGSQWPKMGKRLMDLPVFRHSIQKTHKILEEKGLDLIKIITDDDPKTFDNILHSFVGIAAIQIALLDVLNAIKIVPDGLIGHSVGELGCSYADGCFTAEQMILAAYYRGRASKEAELIKGSMAAIGKGYKNIKDQLPEDIEVACHNSSESCTLSGPTESIHRYVEELKGKGIFAKSVNVSNIAYHSRYIKPAAPKLLEYLKEVVPKPKLRSPKWISTSNPQDKWDTDLAKYCSAEYHTNNLLSSVLFEEGSVHIPKNAICIEIAPHGLLQAILKRSLGEEVVNIPLTNRNCEDPLIFLLQALGKIYMAGVHFQIMGLYPKIEFPVSRGTQHLSPLVHWHEQVATCLPTPLGRKVFYSLKDRLIKLTNDDVGCILNGRNIYPISLFTNLLREIFASIKKVEAEECPVVLQNVNIYQFVEVSLSGDTSGFYFLKGTGNFEIAESKTVLTSGNISMIKEEPLEETAFRLTKPDLINQEIYKELERKGYIYGEYFKVLKAVELGKRRILAEVPVTSDFEQIIEAMIQLALLNIEDHEDFVYFPKYFKTLEFCCLKHAELITAENHSSKHLVIVFDLVLNKMKCGGIIMNGLKFAETSKISKNFKFESFNFFPFMNPNFQDIKTFTDFCFDVVLHNSSSVKNFFSMNILEVLEKSHPISVGNYLQQAYSDVLIKVNSVTNPETEWKAQNIEFAISKDVHLNKVTEFLINGGFILVRATSNTKIPSELKLIGRFINKAKQEFWFLNKVQSNNEEFEFVIMDKNTSSLTTKLKELKYSEKVIFIVAHHKPSQGIHNFIKMMEAETALSLRWLFILDSQAPAFSSDSPFYKEQLHKGLRTNIYDRGSWGWFSKYDYVEDAIKNEINFNLDESPEVTPLYISFELSDNPIQLELIEYSGKMKRGNVMGISELKNYRKIIPDKYLTWEVPEAWSMEDAVTVPNAYAQAYYSLVMLRNNFAQTLLVTDAMTVVGQAHLHVAFTLGLKVYVTVANEKEVLLIKKLFPQFEDVDIMIHNEPNFDVKYKLEKRFKGMDIVINLLDGQHFFPVLNFINKFSKMFYYGRDNVKKNAQMGSGIFLQSLSLYAMTAKTIIQLHEDDKKEIHKLVEEGIKSGTVKPLPKVILSLAELQKLQSNTITDQGRTKTLLQVTNIHPNSGYVQFNSQNSYIVVGDETDLWADVVEWLIKRGLKNIVAGYKTHSKTIELRIPLLKQREKVFIFNHQDFHQLLREAEKLGPVAAVYYISLNSEENSIGASIDKLYRNTKGHLLAISRTQGCMADMCANRNKLGFPSTNFIYNLEQIPIKQNLELMSKLCGKDAKIHISQHSLNTSSDFSLINFVPSTVEDFCDLGSSLENDVKIAPMNTLVGPGKKEFLEITPLLIIPGFQKNPVEFVQRMVANYLYPAACIKIPNMNLSIKQMASFILPEVVRYNKGNLYNIIGISWGCHIAMELTMMLEEMGAKVGLILMHGPILNVNILLKQSLESNFLNLIQGYGKNTTNFKIEKEKSNWEVNLNKALGTFNLPSDQLNHFRNAIEFLYNNMQALLQHDISKFQCKGPLTIISSDKHPFDYKALSKICKFVSIRRLPVSNEDLLMSTYTWTIIHGSAICQNMLSKSIHDCSWPALEEFVEVQKLALLNNQDNPQLLNIQNIIRM